jgi:hypothetical protein
LGIPAGSDGLVTLPHWWGLRFASEATREGGRAGEGGAAAAVAAAAAATAAGDLSMYRGATIGWSNVHTRAHLYHSLLEGLSFEIRRMLQVMCRQYQPLLTTG